LLYRYRVTTPTLLHISNKLSGATPISSKRIIFAHRTFADGDVLLAAELFQMAADCRQEDVQSPALLAQSRACCGETKMRWE